jgi:hypothetical protein
MPAGGTSTLQLLDIKVFGALKSTARKVWGQRYAKDPTSKQTKASSVQILLDCWDELNNDSIIARWKLFKSEQRLAVPDTDATPDPDPSDL